jgi:hypothetical protein
MCGSRVIAIELHIRWHALLTHKHAHAYREGSFQLLLRGNSSDSHHRLESF